MVSWQKTKKNVMKQNIFAKTILHNDKKSLYKTVKRQKTTRRILFYIK